MNKKPSTQEFEKIKSGYDKNPSLSQSLHKEAYINPAWHNTDLESIISKTWQWVCHSEKLRKPGS